MAVFTVTRKTNLKRLKQDPNELYQFENVITKFLLSDTEVENEDEMIMNIIVSNEIVDRSGDVVIAKGWETKNFESNNVVLSGHNDRSIYNVLGNAYGVMKRNVNHEDPAMRRLTAKVKYVDYNPMARDDFRMRKDGIIKGWSPRLIFKEYELPGSTRFNQYCEDNKKYHKDKKPRVIVYKSELVEISGVILPDNPMALTTKDIDNIAEGIIEGVNTNRIESKEYAEYCYKQFINQQVIDQISESVHAEVVKKLETKLPASKSQFSVDTELNSGDKIEIKKTTEKPKPEHVQVDPVTEKQVDKPVQVAQVDSSKSINDVEDRIINKVEGILKQYFDILDVNAQKMIEHKIKQLSDTQNVLIKRYNSEQVQDEIEKALDLEVLRKKGKLIIRKDL